MPTLSLYNQQSTVNVDLDTLQAQAEAALPFCLVHPSDAAPSILADLEEVEISFVDDATIGTVHGQFLNDPTPTDVITFHHGEILISTETAARQAAAYDEPLPRELCRYIVHGLLHLAGHTDLQEPNRANMHQIQEEIVAKIMPAL